VAELADAQDLGSCPVRGAGSTPAVRIRGDVLSVFSVLLPASSLRLGRALSLSVTSGAPEQVRCEPAAPSMDRFALGATLYEAVSSGMAFPTAESTAGPGDFPQLRTDPMALPVAGPEVHEDLTRAIDALLGPS
jgi:hypothetical protein